MVEGHNNMRNCIKGHSIRKVENHHLRCSADYPEALCGVFYSVLCHLGQKLDLTKETRFFMS